MGKKIIISYADFAANAIPVAKAIVGTSSPQYIYAANEVNPSSSFNWDSHKIAIQVQEDGSIASLNLPASTTAIPMLVRGGSSSNTWLKEIDFTFLSALPLKSFRFVLDASTSLERVVLGGSFPYVTTAVGMLRNCSNLKEVLIDKSFSSPLLKVLDNAFIAAGMRKITGLRYLITSTCTSAVYAFGDCTQIEEIDLSGCGTGNITSFDRMFYNSCNNVHYFDISGWVIKPNAITTRMFTSAKIYELNANCFTSLYGDITGMFYMLNWNTIHLDNLNDVSSVTASTDLFSNSVSGTPKVTIANVTNSAVKTLLKNALNARTVSGSSNWQETTIDGVLCLVPQL